VSVSYSGEVGKGSACVSQRQLGWRVERGDSLMLYLSCYTHWRWKSNLRLPVDVIKADLVAVILRGWGRFRAG
jgi:hypothetical protein